MNAAANTNLSGSAMVRQAVVYVGEDNRLYLLSFDRTSARWTQYDVLRLVHNQAPFPIADTPAARGGCPLSVWSGLQGNALAYIGDDQGQRSVQLITLDLPGVTNLTNVTRTPMPIANSRLLAYKWAKQGSQHVIYVDTNNNVRELYLDGRGPAQTNDLSDRTGFTNFNAPPPGGLLAGYVWENQGSGHAFYIAQDRTIRELYFTGAWFANNLSNITGAPAPRADSPLAAYVCEFQNTQHVVYIAENGHVQEIYYSGNRWVAGQPDLTQTTGTPPPAAGSALVGYSAEYEQTQHVVYVDGNGHLQELYWSGGAWANTDLTDSVGSGATPPRGGTPLAGYPFEAERTHHVLYVDINNSVHEFYRSGNSWGSGVVSGSIPLSN
jgi:hypothetical protein